MVASERSPVMPSEKISNRADLFPGTISSSRSSYLRSLSILFWLFFPALALGASHGAAPFQTQGSAALRPHSSLRGAIQHHTRTAKAGQSRPTVQTSDSDDDNVPHRRDERRQAVPVAAGIAPLVRRRTILSAANVDPPHALHLARPGRSPPAC